MWGTIAPYRSVNEIVEHLKLFPMLTETEIQNQVFGYDRKTSFGSNKKYAEMLRRGLDKGIISRLLIPKESRNGNHSRYFYYVPPMRFKLR